MIDTNSMIDALNECVSFDMALTFAKKDLNPCPYCGTMPHIFKWIGARGISSFQLRCSGCGASSDDVRVRRGNYEDALFKVVTQSLNKAPESHQKDEGRDITASFSGDKTDLIKDIMCGIHPLRDAEGSGENG